MPIANTASEIYTHRNLPMKQILHIFFTKHHFYFAIRKILRTFAVMKTYSDIDTSGIWQAEPSSGRVGDGFTECTVIPTGGPALLVKARRQGRWWMLKGLKEQYRNEPFYVELFEKEVVLTTSLQHPNIVHTIGTELVAPYGRCLIMEYLDGSTLDAFLQTKPAREVRRALSWQLLDVMEYIHSKQVVHRDLKPTNIIITHNGKHLKLIDFGLADNDAYYILKQPAGTEGYASPEQHVSRTADIRNDLYSIGVLLRHMKLGWLTDLALRKCLCRAENRYANISELRKGIHRTKTIFLTLCLLAFVIPLGIVSEELWTADQAYKATVEQFRDSMTQKSLEDKQVIAQFRDSLHAATQHEHQLLRKEQARTQHEQTKQAFIAEKEKVLVREYKKLENPKHPIWHGGDFSAAVTEIHTSINRWVEERKDFTAEERAAIITHLGTISTQYIQRLTQKWTQQQTQGTLPTHNQ